MSVMAWRQGHLWRGKAFTSVEEGAGKQHSGVRAPVCALGRLEFVPQHSFAHHLTNIY